MAGDTSISVSHSFGSKSGDTTKDEGSLSINHNTRSFWIDETIGYDKVSGIKTENFLGGGPKYKLSENISLSIGLLWQHTENEDDYLFSGRVKYKIGRFKIVGYYQPYLNKEGYLASGKVVFNPGDTIEFSESLNYRSDEDIFGSTFGVRYNF
jgi:hypothetical protein